jgi:hypothetical protein
LIAFDYWIVVNDHGKCFQPSDTAALKLPSSVFGSEVETKVGLLNRAAPMKGKTGFKMKSKGLFLGNDFHAMHGT